MLTFTNSWSTTGLRQAISLTHRAAETRIHEALCGSRQRRSTWQQDSCSTSQQRANFVEHQPGGINRRQITRGGKLCEAQDNILLSWLKKFLRSLIKAPLDWTHPHTCHIEACCILWQAAPVCSCMPEWILFAGHSSSLPPWSSRSCRCDPWSPGDGWRKW